MVTSEVQITLINLIKRLKKPYFKSKKTLLYKRLTEKANGKRQRTKTTRKLRKGSRS